jgi:hypothetical protein
MTSEVQNTINYAINSHDSPAAIKVLNLVKKDPALNIEPKISMQLRYIRMNSLSLEQLLALMSESILVAYSIPDFDLSVRIGEYIEMLDNVDSEIKFTQGLLKLLDDSEELLGQFNINLNNISVKATLGNWLEDYSRFTAKDKKKDVLTEFEYINNSPNVKNLNLEEKNILKNIIKLYDNAVQIIASWNSIKLPASEGEIYKDYDLYRLVPGLEDELEEEKEAKKRRTVPRAVVDVVPIVSSKPQMTLVSKEVKKEISSKNGKADQIKGIPDDYKYEEKNIFDSPQNGIPSSPKGVVKDATNIKLAEERKRLTLERDQQGHIIEKKLEELRKRRSTNNDN